MSYVKYILKSVKAGRTNAKWHSLSDGTLAISSYNTLIAIYHNGLVYELPNAHYSATTSKHYQAWLLSCNLEKKPILKNYPPAVITHWNDKENYRILGQYDNLQADLWDLKTGRVNFPKLTPDESIYATVRINEV